MGNTLSAEDRTHSFSHLLGRNSMSEVKVPYWVISLNLLLWLVAGGAALSSGAGDAATWTAFAGLIFAAILQHQAYYRRARDRKKDRTASGSGAT